MSSRWRSLAGRGSMLQWMLAAASALTLVAGCASGRCDSVAAFGNLGPEINSPFDDYAPALQDTATIVFTSNRIVPGRDGLKEHAERMRPTHLFTSMRLTASWDDAVPYPLLLGEEEVEAGTYVMAPAGSPFGTTAYVSICGAAGSLGGCDIYAVTSERRVALVNLGPTINSPGWDGQPSITRPGDRLYFASDRAGGIGGTDIWYSTRGAGGAWGAPINAGPGVNSESDELAPFVLEDNRLLFVADAPGRGREIFVADLSGGQREPLDAPYNSEFDELTPFRIGGVLYLASNRPGGCGGYDLYAFPM